MSGTNHKGAILIATIGGVVAAAVTVITGFAICGWVLDWFVKDLIPLYAPVIMGCSLWLYTFLGTALLRRARNFYLAYAILMISFSAYTLYFQIEASLSPTDNLQIVASMCVGILIPYFRWPHLSRRPKPDAPQRRIQ